MTLPSSHRSRVLILGGTADASALARTIAAEPAIDAVLSFAGRTDQPKPPPIPFRIGGFGGISGLADYLRAENIERVVDATHPFAAQMSRHAAIACAEVGVPLLALERPAWQAVAGDSWIEVEDLDQAVGALGAAPRRVFLGIGRQNLELFAAQPQHTYLVRLVDPPRGPLPLPNVEVVVARGPFDLAGDRALLQAHRTEIVVAKNAGGDAAVAKITAARELGLPVIMVKRPAVPDRRSVATVADVMAWLGHDTAPENRGV